MQSPSPSAEALLEVTCFNQRKSYLSSAVNHGYLALYLNSILFLTHDI